VFGILLYQLWCSVDENTLTTLELNLNSTVKFEYCLLESYRHFIWKNTTEYIQDEMK